MKRIYVLFTALCVCCALALCFGMVYLAALVGFSPAFGAFTWKDFQARNNNELVAVYGNFVNRALVLTHKYFDGKVPVCGELTDYDKETLKEFADVKAEVEKLLDVFKFRDAVSKEAYEQVKTELATLNADIENIKHSNFMKNGTASSIPSPKYR